jgi:MFS family permease
MLGGCVVLTIGATSTAVAVSTSSAVVFLISTAIAGIGFGSAYLGAYRTLVELASPSQRGALVSAIFTVAYLAMAAPAVIAGLVATHLGLQPTAIGFGAAVAGLSAVSAAATHLTGQRPPDAGHADPQIPQPEGVRAPRHDS